MSVGQSPEAKIAKEDLMPIEGSFCDGEFALYEQNGAKAEACISRDRKMAYAAVRGLTEEYSFDMINSHTKRVDASVKTPLIMAKEALATAMMNTNGSKHTKK